MSSAKGKLLRLLSRVVLRQAQVVSVEDVAEGFRRITLRGALPRPEPGTKVQMLLPSDDVRTYSPIPSDEEGSVTLLCWKHAGGPGARWVSSVAPRERVRFLGPQRSLDLPATPMIVVGDETSIGVAASFASARPAGVQAVLHCASPDAARLAAASVGLERTHIVGGDSGAREVIEAVVAARDEAPTAKVFLTGGSDLLVEVRAALRKRGIDDITSKAYWVPGKTGLD